MKIKEPILKKLKQPDNETDFWIFDFKNVSGSASTKEEAFECWKTKFSLFESFNNFSDHFSEKLNKVMASTLDDMQEPSIYSKLI